MGQTVDGQWTCSYTYVTTEALSFEDVIGQTTVVVVHTWPEGRDETGRIISARKATARERKAYEEGES